MTRPRPMLRWYPKAWRDRYGEELAALLDDTYGDRPLPLGCRLSLARSGIGERLRDLPARAGGPADRVRSGSLLVLCAWAVFVVAGTGFAKSAEHWDAATPAGARGFPSVAYDSVQWAAAVGTLIVLVGALLCLPAFARLLRRGNWPQVRRPVLAAATAIVVASLAGTAVVIWAHHLRATGDDGRSVALRLGLAVWVFTICAAIGLCSTGAVAVVRRLDLGTRLVRIEGVLALSMTGVMAVVTGGTLAWWVSVARVAPGFFAGGPAGTPGLPTTPALLVSALLMVSGLAVAAVAALWIVRSLARLGGAGPAA